MTRSGGAWPMFGRQRIGGPGAMHAIIDALMS